MTDLTPPHALVFIKYEDQPSLARTIQRVNAARRQVIPYRTLILTAARQRWTGLLFGAGASDHLLLRNLSGQLGTTAFELELGYFGFAYRLHSKGRTVAAFESNLVFYVNNRLQWLAVHDDTSVLDLAEPVERFVLRRHQEQQHVSSAGVVSSDVPDDLQAQYVGDASALRPVLKPDVTDGYVAELLAPGFRPEAAFERLAACLSLPYLPPDEVLLDQAGGDSRVLAGFALTRPATWVNELPSGWRRVAALPPDPA
ncbi:MAG: hypothetical protein JW910_13635 [Anaerolineae bacterium]|nr:hypothetical protein [Anaerolineae bacterium]